MKTVFKFLTLGMMLMAFAVAPAFAQDECEGLYNQFTAKYKSKNVEEQKSAVSIGDQFVSKCTTEDLKPNREFVEKQVAKLKASIESTTTIDCFNNSVKDAKNVNADNAYRCGKQILAGSPDLVDVPLVLATIGFDKAVAPTPVDTYNAEAINYAKQAIQKIESGAKSEQYGAYGYVYKTKEYADGKSNALAWMNYTIGYIMYNRQNQKKEALPYLYKSMQYTSGVKKNPVLYQTIGDWYRDEYNRIDKERTQLVADAKTKTDEAEKKALIDKAKEMLLLQKGYADRMIDAYGRAHALAGTDQAYKTGLYNDIKLLYGFRFDNANAAGLDKYISDLVAKPMPDPLSAVTPVVDTPATTTPATTTPTNGATTTTTSMTSTTKPSTTMKPTTADTQPATTTKAKTTKTPTKTTPKKKGTR